MSKDEKDSIELAEFIQQVKKDLLSVTPEEDKDAPFLFVESVELELQVTAKRTGKGSGKGSIKINVLGTGGEIGGEVGGDISQEKIQKVKVKLSPLFDKERLIKWYKALHPDQGRAIAENAIEGLLKGDDDSNLNDDLGE